ncbi:MAG: hypothetical protein PHE24_00740 [Patescibacteria group bacterium]|nr:hypothetical protein [Patescibacteria group bacterium]
MALVNKTIFVLAFLALFFSARQVLAADNIKTTEFYIYDSALPVSSAVSQDFSVYIGDNIGAVTDPIKSAYFKISGTYTGGGTLDLKINSGNSKIYNLPTVGSPTYFELLYADTSSVIDPSSAGNYSYNFSLTPDSVTIYGLGVKLDLTYQYQPAFCPDGSSQKVKTTEFYVYDSDSVINPDSNISQDFPVYIGDNIGAVTDPIKSAYFKVSGTYTGGGSINFTLNSGNSQIYNLPSAVSPTYFELLYADTSAMIAPGSAGTYYFNLGINPTGVTIYGAGAALDLTYQYAPPSCAGLPPTGELTSAIFDTIQTAAYNSIMWQGTFNGGNGRVRFKLATSNSSSGPWNPENFFGSSDNGVTCDNVSWYDPGAPETPIEITCAPANHNNQRYFRYKVQLCSYSNCTDSGSASPEVNKVIVNWSP